MLHRSNVCIPVASDQLMELFAPNEVTTRSGTRSYRYLNNRVFSPLEKIMLCAIIEGDVEEMAEKLTLQQWCDRYGLSINTVKTWLKKYRAKKTFESGPGVPPVFTDASRERIAEALAKNKQLDAVTTGAKLKARPRWDRAQTRQLLDFEFQRSEEERQRAKIRMSLSKKTTKKEFFKELKIIKTGRASCPLKSRPKSSVIVYNVHKNAGSIFIEAGGMWKME